MWLQVGFGHLTEPPSPPLLIEVPELLLVDGFPKFARSRTTLEDCYELYLRSVDISDL
jgi:hypothetical protein